MRRPRLKLNWSWGLLGVSLAVLGALALLTLQLAAQGPDDCNCTRTPVTPEAFYLYSVASDSLLGTDDGLATNALVARELRSSYRAAPTANNGLRPLPEQRWLAYRVLRRTPDDNRPRNAPGRFLTSTAKPRACHTWSRMCCTWRGRALKRPMQRPSSNWKRSCTTWSTDFCRWLARAGRVSPASWKRMPWLRYEESTCARSC
ncbi:MAG: hypothetical protein ACRENP_14450 [Longimicrobiales bacterium]